MTAPPRIRPTTRALTLDHTAVDQTAVIRPADTADSTEQKFSLSATQVLASMAAAVTAALVGSRLGVAGTVIGAGLASVISVVGGAVIGHSILLTRKQVKRAVQQVRGAGEEDPAGDRTMVISAVDYTAGNRTRVIPADDHTAVIPAVTRLDLQRASQDARTGPGHAEPGRPRPTRPGRPRVSTGVLGVAAAVAIFVSALGAVTVFETIKGSPLSGGESGGLSVLGGNSGHPVDAPLTTTAVVTAPATVTQTVTSEVTAPATTAPATSAPATTAQSSPAQSSAPSSSVTPSSATTTGSSAAVPNSAAATVTEPAPAAR